MQVIKSATELLKGSGSHHLSLLDFIILISAAPTCLCKFSISYCERLCSVSVRSAHCRSHGEWIMSSPLKTGRSEWRECTDRDEAGFALDGSTETVLMFSSEVAQITVVTYLSRRKTF